jgi:hypothetical protein
VRRRQKSGITERDLSHFRYLSVLAVRLNKQNKEKPATIKFTRRWAKRKRKRKLLLDRQSYTVYDCWMVSMSSPFSFTTDSTCPLSV